MTQPARVDHVVTSLGEGGAETLVYNLAQEQTRRGYEVGVWTLFQGPPSSPQFRKLAAERTSILTSLGVSVRTIGNGSRDARAGFRLRTALKGVDSRGVLHVHSAATALAARVAGRSGRTVMTLHNINFNLPDFMLRAMIRSLGAYTAVSEESSLAFEELLGRPVKYVKNGVPVSSEVPSRLTRQPPYEVLSVGRLDTQKNYARLIEAINLTRADHGGDLPAFRLTIVGSGPLRGDLQEKITSTGSGALVTLVGVRSDVPVLMRASDVFVMTSDWEGMPMALLEAMGAGLACVTTPFPTAFDLLDDGAAGIIARDFSAASFATELARLLRSPGQVEYFKRAAFDRAQEFSIEACANAYDKIYEALL